MKISFKVYLLPNNPGWEIILYQEGILEDFSCWCLSTIEEVKKMFIALNIRRIDSIL